MNSNKLSDQKMDFVIMGSEESHIINDFGYRSLIFAKALSQSKRVGKVLVVNCPISFPRRVTNRIFGKKRVEDMYPVAMERSMATVFKTNEKMYMLNLTSSFPESDNAFFKAISEIHTNKSISSILKLFGFNDFVLWVTTPRMVGIASKIESRIRIFDAIDDMLAHPQMKIFYRRIKKAYAWVEDNADLICIASEGQRKMFPKAKNLFLMPNSVDNEFLKDLTPEVPVDMKDIKKPIIGYIGVLQDRFDVPLVEEVAKTLSKHNFVFVGPVKDASYFKLLAMLKNVHFLGIKKYTEIPFYINSFDVCIIPHKVNEFTDSMNPIKIYEYLACGKPIVSTPIAGSEKFREYIYLAKDPETFADAIRKALIDGNANLSADRRREAARYSWDSRIRELMVRIEELLQNKQDLP